MIYLKKINSKFLKDKRKYILISKKEDKFKFFGELNLYITDLLKKLWENPKIVSIILSNSDIEDLKNNLADFFMNNFYENILSSKCIENNLLYLISLLLKDEINNLLNKETPEFFLNSTRCGYFLEKLIEKKELKMYFKTILFDVFEKLNNEFSREFLSFEAEILNENIKNLQHENKNITIETNEENNLKGKDCLNSKIIKKDIENNKNILFNIKYSKALNENDLNKYLSEKENNNIKDFIININNNINKNSKLYETKIFSNEINDKNQNIINLYKEYYFKISEFMDIILNNLSLKNLNLVPYPIKCICKLISKLLEIKFPKIKNYEKNAFISKFFFYILLSPVLINPGFIGLIKDFSISQVQESNLSIIDKIIKKFVIGELFIDDEIEGNYTPFNWIFIEKMPKLIEFFDNLNNVELPNFIENIINENLNNNYKYDYYKENNNEIITHNSICYNIDNIYSLIYNIKKCKTVIFNEKINKDIEILITRLLKEENLEKLNNLKTKKHVEIIKEEIPEELLSYRSGRPSKMIERPKENKILIDSNKEKEILKYFLLVNIIFEEKYKNSFDIKQEKSYYNILNDKKDDNKIIQNTKLINNIKNFLCAILFNYKTLSKEDFDRKSLNNISDILNTIKENMKLSNILIDYSIPSDWYIDSFLELIKKLPEEFINNDYEKLIKQIENDIKESINNINFSKICFFIDKLKIAKDLTNYYNSVINILLDIKLTLKTNYFIKNSIIPMAIKYKKKKSRISFKPINEKYRKNENGKEIDKEIEIFFCQTIEDFIINFPDISNEFFDKKINPFILLQKTKFFERINNFLKIIQQNIRKEKKAKNEIEVNMMILKIYDYIMEKLYLKILPSEPDPMDTMIYLNCEKINWIEPKHLLKTNNDFIFSNFILDLSKYFEIINKQKCPRKKLYFLEELFKTVNNFKVFNGDKSQGVDSEITLLNYGIIKAKPKNLYSNCKYMKFFLGNKKGKIEDSHLTQLLLLSSEISKLNHTYLMNVSESEYNEKCKKNILNFI